jgi:hypothetical protein
MTVSAMIGLGRARRVALAAVLVAGLAGVALSVSNPQWFDGSTGVAGGVMMGPMPAAGAQGDGDYVLDDLVQELTPPPVDDPREHSRESRGRESGAGGNGPPAGLDGDVTVDDGTGDGSMRAFRPER